MHGVISMTSQRLLLHTLVTTAPDRSRTPLPYDILSSYWQKRTSTALQRAINVLHVAEMKVDRQWSSAYPQTLLAKRKCVQ
mmetsp:Transcript_6105/g.11675  ORF Transcript_6105/g.11675 Transcript_6105/m.11675 type:complete len:81 (-) Transcript_6105:172-414(-)